ncbi:MAG: TonB-dependent receptor, partial [Caulobacter sp.]
TPASFLAGQVNLENQQAGYDILPRQRRDGLDLSLAQDLTPAIELSGEARAGRRRFHLTGAPANATIVVDGNNPYYVSPTGEASETIAYSFQREGGGQKVDGTSDTLALSLGGQARLPAGWRLDGYGAYALETLDAVTSRLLHSSHLDEAVGLTADNPATAFSTAGDGYFNPFAGDGSNSKTLVDFILGGWGQRKIRSDTRSANLKLDGTLWSLPAGAVGLAVGAQVRREHLKTGGLSFLYTDVPTSLTRKDAGRTVTAAFAEARVPLFGLANARPGLQRLELSAAVRREDYGGEVRSTDPKLGAIWSPIAGATLKASYGTSFRAPALTELNDAQIYAPTILPNGSAQVITMLMYGGNPDLEPETATSRTLTLELAPRRFPAFKASATLFDTRFKNRIGRPAVENVLTVLSSPEFAKFRTFVSPAANAADYARVQALIDAPVSYAQGVFPTSSYGAIVDARYVNTGELRVRGLDASAQYAARLGADPLDLAASLSWLIDYQRKITPDAAAIEQAGQVGYPADLRLRASAAWTHGLATTTLSLNRVGDLHDDAGRRVAPWTSVDLNLRLAPSGAAWRGVTVSLNVQNLFDQDPPFYDSPLALGYDPTNADPSGRVVTVLVTKAW